MEQAFAGLARMWSNFADFVHDYQTLIAGLVAIAAAFVTARPVWRQLRNMSVQTGMMHREFLAERLRALLARRKWLADRLDGFASEIGQRMLEMRELEGKLNVHWIFERSQITWSLIGRLETDRVDRRDPASVALALDAVMAALQALYETLEDIHRPESTDQGDVDDAISDEEWAAVGQNARDADARLDKVVGDFERAHRGLRSALDDEIGGLRDSLKTIDDRLVNSAGFDDG